MFKCVPSHWCLTQIWNICETRCTLKQWLCDFLIYSSFRETATKVPRRKRTVSPNVTCFCQQKMGGFKTNMSQHAHSSKHSQNYTKTTIKSSEHFRKGFSCERVCWIKHNILCSRSHLSKGGMYYLFRAFSNCNSNIWWSSEFSNRLKTIHRSYLKM